MASIRRRGSGWQVQIRLAGAPPQAKTFRTKAEATSWARVTEAHIQEQDRVPDAPADHCLEELLKRYLGEVTPSKRSHVQESSRITRLIADPIARLPVAELTPRTIADFRDRRLHEVGPQAVIHDLAVLGHLIKIATNEWGVELSSNPVSKVRKPQQPAGRCRRLTKDEEHRLGKAVARLGCPHLPDLVQFALETAMRQSEILGLAWTDIDFTLRVAYLRKTKNGHSRSVPLSKSARAILERRYQAGFPNPFPLPVRRMQRSWVKATASAAVDDLHFHDLRHEAISRLFEKGLSMPEVALISGHRDPRMLMRYTHMLAASIVSKLD